MSSVSCYWDIYDAYSRTVLGIGLYIAGTMSLILSSLVFAAFLKNSLTNERSHLMLLNLCLASLARSLLTGFVFTGISALYGRWIFGSASCKLFAFVHQFVSVYQIEALTHMCIERYVVAKYIKNGWVMNYDRYTLFVGLCWLFSTLYSVAPLLGIGEYCWDYSCTACGLSLILPEDTWRRYMFIGMLLLQSVKPVVVMLFMISWASQIEKDSYNEKEQQNNILLTKSSVNITWITLLMWCPTFFTSLWVIAEQVFEPMVAMPPIAVIMIASFGSEIAPAATMTAILWTNTHVCQATKSLFGRLTHSKNC